MSKIFEVLIKQDRLDVADLSPEPASTAQNSGVVQAPSKPANSVYRGRPLSLRVSTLTPIFPFSEQADHAAMEQYRIIRTKILHHPKKPRLLLVSSACVGDGKTISSINIAASLSLKAGSSVLLIDADLRRPKIAELLGIPGTPGLADVVAGRASLDDALIHAAEFPALSILPAGERTENAAELLDSDAWRGLVGQIHDRFSNVILDSPPVGVVADHDLLQNAADGTIVVVRPDHTDREVLLNALQSIPKEKLIGVVLNCAQDWLLWRVPGYHKYYGKSLDSQ